MKQRQFGLPLKCPKCPSKWYFGMLKGSAPTGQIKVSASDTCPNCRTRLVKAGEERGQ